eukprot:Nitzschia sp. Nitz4//scaffold61_size107673//99152//100413//NITZ4_004255-RA/size107673-snap-gene-0.122-mRNA-1//-1//CDS//3329555770//6831//frame0
MSFRSAFDWVSMNTVASYTRPGLILVCGMLLFNLPTLIYKMGMLGRSVMYLTMCKDKSWKKPRDPDLVVGPIIAAGEPVERKTVYFVRHGESTWNDTFNKGSHRSAAVFAAGFVPGLVKALLYETYLILSGKLDSWFYDAPISDLGLGQIKDLSKFLNQTPASEDEAKHIAVLRADPGAPPSKIVSSSLRRAVSTVALAFKERLSRRPQEKILIIPSLQEISRNPDTLSITPPHTPIQASWIDKTFKECNFQELFLQQVDMSLHTGNKPVSTNGLKRMQAFCDFVFSPSAKEDYVIAGGHSIWFRSFFQMYLPYTATHMGKTKKMVNGGVVSFELVKANTPGGPQYMIDPDSVHVVYGGFH